jgi:hypothetical protein
MTLPSDHHWRCDCGGGHFLTITWDPDEKPRADACIEGYLSVEGDNHTPWRDRIAQAWRVIASGHSATRVGVILDAAKAREIAAVLVDFSDDASALGDYGPVPVPPAGGGKPTIVIDVHGGTIMSESDVNLLVRKLGPAVSKSLAVAGLRRCGHCGRVGAEASADKVRLCHPSDPALPDCYRRVTVYSEPAGALLGLDPKPAGVDAIIQRGGEEVP